VRTAPAARATKVVVEALAPGVWLLNGESHHSVVVELSDHLVLIEAPADDARTLAVIGRARELQPAKPLTHAVITHHHFDHSGGVRAAVSQGLTLIAHEKNRRFIESMVSRPHTISPDALARHPRPLSLQTVGARTVLGDSTRAVELHVVDSAHADGMLVAYLPAERLLVEVDLYTVPAPEWPRPRSYPFARALVDVVTSHRLEVERVVPLHQAMAPFADLVAAARLGLAPRADSVP
jgi:glyoxylase-like metal-dependent hydrolase (beta-lactamase superfamily II)